MTIAGVPIRASAPCSSACVVATDAPEIAADMLRRQQAEAVVAARFRIVEGAVSMVEMALDHLSQKKIIELDEERKAAMVSNLMVVLCSDKDVNPVVNTGTLNH